MVKSRVLLGMVIPPLIGNPYNGYINPYYWVDDHPLLYGNHGSLDPGTYIDIPLTTETWICVSTMRKEKVNQTYSPNAGE